MGIIDAVFLGIVQGLTEFLPISSSGHLALINTLYASGSADRSFFVIVHFGTMFATVVVFYREVRAVLLAVPGALRLKQVYEDDPSSLLLRYIVVATIPTIIIALCLSEAFDRYMEDRAVVGVMLIVTAGILFLTRFVKEGNREEKSFGNRGAFLVGCAQGLAVIPGISRSGSTIAATLFLKGNRAFAGRFAFLISLPAIFAANAYEVFRAYQASGSFHFGMSNVIGFVVAFIVGIAALKFFLKVIHNGKLHYFSAYCLCVGVFAIFSS